MWLYEIEASEGAVYIETISLSGEIFKINIILKWVNNKTTHSTIDIILEKER